MTDSCARCAATDAVRVAARVPLCEACIRRALAARFPVFGLPLSELETALASFEQRPPRRAAGR